MSIAMANMTKSQKKKKKKKIELTISKHSKKFNFRQEKYNSTWTVHK